MSDTQIQNSVVESDAGLFDELDELGQPPTTRPPAPPVEPGKHRRRRILAWILVAALLVFGALAGWYLLNRKPLSELPGLETGKAPTYKTSLYGVDSPLGVAVSPDGERLYVSQSGTEAAAFVLDRNGKKIAELKPPGRGGYHIPVYLTVSPVNGDVYVGDRGSGAIYIYAADGTYRSTFTPKGKVGAFSPLGLAVAGDGTVYVADAAGSKPADHRILVFSKDGTLIRTLGKGKLNFPNAVVVRDDGAVYVTDSNNARVVGFDKSGKETTLLSRGIGEGDLGLPRGMTIDDKGRLFVVDTTDHMVRLYATSPSPTTVPVYIASIGDQGVQDGQFMYPNGVAADARARIYVTDRQNNRIQVWGY